MRPDSVTIKLGRMEGGTPAEYSGLWRELDIPDYGAEYSGLWEGSWTFRTMERNIPDSGRGVGHSGLCGQHKARPPGTAEDSRQSSDIHIQIIFILNIYNIYVFIYDRMRL